MNVATSTVQPQLMVWRRLAFWFLVAMLSKPGSPVRAQTGNPYDSGGPLMPEQAAYDVTFYDLNLRVDPDAQRIDGVLTVRAIVVENMGHLVLDLDPILTVDSVKVVARSGEPVPAEAAFQGAKLWVSLPEELQPFDTVSASVYYGGQPRRAPSPPWSGGFVWRRTASGDHWIGVACEGEGADIWWPCKDHPSDEPDSMALHLTVPQPLICVSNGRPQGVTDNQDGTRTFHWFVSTPINNYGVSLYAAPYRTIAEPYVSTSGDTIPVTFWVLPEDYDGGVTFFPQILQHLRFLEKNFGPYPFRADKYGVAEAPYLGMEHQTIIAYGNHYRNNSYGFDDLHFHELAHEWFGNLVTAADWKDLWLHEGFATYAEALYAGYLHGMDSYHSYMARFRSGIRNRSPLAPRESCTEGQIYSGELYYKGAWVLHTLRFLLGDQVFFRTLRRFAYPDSVLERVTDGSQCRLVDTEDFIDTAESISGLELDWFFEVYVRQPALPRLIVDRGSRTTSLRWEVPGGLPFPMPVQVRVGNEVRLVNMPGGQGTVKIDPGAEIEIDPDSWILMNDPVFTGVADYSDQLPEGFALYQNFPNPFNAGTVIRYWLPRVEWVTLRIFDLGGQEVALLVNGQQNRGEHAVYFRADNLAAGLYLCELHAGPFRERRKMLLLK